MSKTQEQWTFIPLDRLKKYMDIPIVAQDVCPNCRHRAKSVRAYPYAYDPDCDEVMFAITCEQCGITEFVKESDIQHVLDDLNEFKPLFIVGASTASGKAVGDDSYCTIYPDGIDAIHSAEDYAWQLACDIDTIYVSVLKVNFDGNGHISSVNNVFTACNREYKEPPEHIRQEE